MAVAIAAVVRIRFGFPFWLAYLAGVNVVTFFAYLYDKAAAGRSAWRVPERGLHILAFAGGSPAAVVGQAAFRHKTAKRSFRIWFWGIVIVQIAAIIIWTIYPR